MNRTNDIDTNGSTTPGNRTTISTVIAFSLQIVIALLAIGGNTFIIAIYTKYKNLQDSTSAFIINLGITDLITGFAILIALFLEQTGLRQNTYIGCIGTASIAQYLVLVSHSIILITTLERYFGICKRDSYNKVMTKRLKYWLILCAWSLPFPVSFLSLFGFNYWEEKGCMLPQIHPKWTLTLRTAFHVLQVAISIVLYINMLLKARELQSTVRPGPMQGMNPSTARFHNIRKSLKSSRIIALVTVIFFVNWLPYNISIIVYCLGDIWTNKALALCFKLFGLTNSMINPFLYAWQKRCIRKKWKSMIKCTKGESGFNSAGQTATTRCTVPREMARTGNSKEAFEMSGRNIQHLNSLLPSKRLNTCPETKEIISLRSYSDIQQISDM